MFVAVFDLTLHSFNTVSDSVYPSPISVFVGTESVSRRACLVALVEAASLTLPCRGLRTIGLIRTGHALPPARLRRPTLRLHEARPAQTFVTKQDDEGRTHPTLATRSIAALTRRRFGWFPRGSLPRSEEPNGRPRDRRLHDRPTLAPRVRRSSSSCANVSTIASAAPVPAASRASFEE